MQNEPERPAEPAAGPDARTQIGQAVHDLRNGMNSLVMNAAVLGARIGDVPEPLRPFVTQIAAAGKKCSEDLTKLYALIDAVRR